MSVIFVSGVWDLFHVGHLNVIERASQLGDKLVVGVLTDEHVAKWQPEKFLVIPFEQRYAIVSALRCVDAAEAHRYPTDLSAMLKHGATIRVVEPGWLDKPRHKEAVEWIFAMGGEIITIPRTSYVSSTFIRQKIRKARQ